MADKESDNKLQCPVCKVDVDDILYTFRHETIYVCRLCGLGISSAKPARDGAEDRYSRDYYEESYPGSTDIESDGQVGSGIFERIEQTAKSRGKLLDVGCGTGQYLSAALNHGWEPWGIDISPYAARVAASRTGVHAVSGTLEESDFAPSSFDAVIMIHALEHQFDPRRTLSEVHRLLRPGGALFISVPNMRSAEAKRHGAAWRGWQPGFHFYFFTKTSLALAVENAGFRVVSNEALPSIISGGAVDARLGSATGTLVRRIARFFLGGLVNFARKRFSKTHEGESIELLSVRV